MAFFKKRAADAEELARLKSEIAAVTARFEASETEKRELGGQVDALAANLERQREQFVAAEQARTASTADLDVVRGRMVQLSQRVDAHDAATPTPLPSEALDELREQLLKLDRRIDEQIAIHTENSPGVDAAAIDGLRERLDAVDVRIDAVASMRAIDPSVLHGLQTRLDDLARRFDVPISAPPSTPPPPPLTESPHEAVDAHADDTDETDAGRDDRALFAELRQQVIEVSDRLDGVDTRLVSISRELAMQIDELSRELDDRASDDGDDDDQIVSLVDELRDAQSRLAAEQARYQIAFREDLADLANRLT